MTSETQARVEPALPDEWASLRKLFLEPLERQGGVRGLLRHVFAIGPRESARLTVNQLHKLAAVAVDRLYDCRHGVDTCGYILPAALDVNENGRASSEPYVPTPERSFCRMMKAVPVDFRDYTFVDVGCGKGRALLIAAAHPFRAVIGIEHSSTLAQTAVSNFASYRDGSLRCNKIAVLQVDATAFEIPPGPCLFYLFSPFRPHVLSRVVERIDASYRRAPRPMVALFSEERDTRPLPMALFDGVAGMEPIAESALPFDPGAPCPLIYAVYANAEAQRAGVAPLPRERSRRGQARRVPRPDRGHP
jgi:SAM-dependent methyltransferase